MGAFDLLTPTLVAVCIFAFIAYIPLLIWRFALKKRTGPTFGQYSLFMFLLSVSFGILGFIVGFFGPIVLGSESPQGPLLGIFITGPLGALTGVIGSWVWFYVKRANS